MPDKFLRECFITILETPFGKPDTIIKQVWGYDQNKTTNKSTGLRINFTIEKQLTDVADTAIVKIYNLNQESRLALAQRSIYLYKTTRVRTLQIQAGYVDTIGALFSGGIERVTNTRVGPDWITEITASSALAQIMFNLFDKNWQSTGGTPALTINDESALKAGLGKIEYSREAKTLLQNTKISSFYATGSAYETVRKLIRSMGLVFTTDINKTFVVVPGNPLTTANPTTVDELSGLIGSPKINDMGYEFRTLIDHRITIGRLVKVESQTLEESAPGLGALATVWTMNVTGDTHEDDWYMNVHTMFYPPQLQPIQNLGQQPVIIGEKVTGL